MHLDAHFEISVDPDDQFPEGGNVDTKTAIVRQLLEKHYGRPIPDQPLAYFLAWRDSIEARYRWLRIKEISFT